MSLADIGKQRACACAVPERVVRLLSTPAGSEHYDVIFDVLNSLAENGKCMVSYSTAGRRRWLIVDDVTMVVFRRIDASSEPVVRSLAASMT